jgi:UDP-N-acetylmuramoylalanine--D-glutamate ligase
VSEAGDQVFPLGASVAGGRFAVYGLARSGLASVRALVAAGASVMAWDSKPEARDAAAALGAEIVDPQLRGLAGLDGIVMSPGVPINRHPLAALAREQAVPMISDIELFARARRSLPSHKVVGITGTNGKSTVTALIHHLLVTGGKIAAMGGNIGIPILAQPSLPRGGIHVLELSSYQIDLTRSLDCDVAILTNVTPDHLDRYGSFEAYSASKARLFAMQNGWRRALGQRMAIFGADDAEAARIAATVPDSDLVGEAMLLAGEAETFGRQADWPALQGPHNARNAAIAISAAIWLGVGPARIKRGLRSFRGLPHRLEQVAELDGVIYVNDSKATNAASAAPALAAYPPGAGGPRIHWIVGGLAKEEGVGECAALLGHIARAYLIGEAAPMLARALDGKVSLLDSGTLAMAVASAHSHARPGDVVLLSPAAASFDQFRDFEHRGDVFRQLVLALKGAKRT